MSKVPYIFETPIPVFFRREGWFKSDNTLKFVSWCFSRCSCVEREVLHDGKMIRLKPFQFIFGRFVCSNETNMSEMEVRTQQNLMQNSGLLKKAPNKTPNRFTIYEWVLSRFNELNNQQNNQQATNKQPTSNHNLEPRSKKIKVKEDIDTTTIIEEKGGGGFSEDIHLVNAKGQKVSKTSSEIYSHFLKSDYPTAVIAEAIQQTKAAKEPVNDILKYLEAICLRLHSKSKTQPIKPTKKQTIEMPVNPEKGAKFDMNKLKGIK